MIYGYCCTYRNRIIPTKKKILSVNPEAFVFTDALDSPILPLSDRVQLNNLLEIVAPKDTIILSSITQLSSDKEDCCRLYEKLYLSHVSVICLRQPYLNTETYKSPRELVSIKTPDSSNIQDALDTYTLLLIKNQICLTYDQLQTQTQFSVSRRPQTKPEEKISVLKAKKSILALSSTFGGDKKDAWLINFLDISQRTLTNYKHALKTELEKEGMSVPALKHIYAEKIWKYYQDHPPVNEFPQQEW